MSVDLNDLIDYQPPRIKTGRRELRAEMLLREHKTYWRPKVDKDGKIVGTLPIERREPKRPDGMSARQWKRLRKNSA